MTSSLLHTVEGFFCRQYMPNKAAKYGIKFFNSFYSVTGYVLHSQIYMGKRADGKKEINQGQRVTEDLLLNRVHLFTIA